MENTMTMTGAVEMTSAFTRVWSECPQALNRRRAVVQAPFPGITLPISGLGHLGLLGQAAAAQGTTTPAAIARKAGPARIAGTTDNYMDVTSFRTRRPPV